MQGDQAIAEVVQTITLEALNESYNAGFLEGIRIAAEVASAEVLRSARLLQREELALAVSTAIKARRKMVESPRSTLASQRHRHA